MTPPCCTRAWAKATGRGPLFIHGGAWAVRNEEPYGADGPVSWVPKPTSAEWLAEIVEAGCSPTKIKLHGEVAWVAIWEDDEECDPAPDLRRALCAALNGKPCERKAA